MKKIIALLMVLALCVTAFVSCGDTGLTDAGEYLYSLYKDDATETPSDFDVVGKVMIDGVG